jgi:hypothetical protein
MAFQFATCERKRALEFIQRVYDHDISDTPESAGPLLDLVAQDLVRVQDPMMHGTSPQVVPGTKWVESAEMREKVVAACKLFHDAQ